jgi:hypothetical protein
MTSGAWNWVATDGPQVSFMRMRGSSPSRREENEQNRNLADFLAIRGSP